MGPNIHIYPFNIETGEIGEIILEDVLVSDIGEGSIWPITQEYQCFNKLYIKRNEFIYYYRITNNYEKFEQTLILVRFSLVKHKSICLKTTIVKRGNVQV